MDAKLYLFSVWVNDDAPRTRERGRYIRFYSQALLERGRPFADVRFHLGGRLIARLQERGHTVIRV